MNESTSAKSYATSETDAHTLFPLYERTSRTNAHILSSLDICKILKTISETDARFLSSPLVMDESTSVKDETNSTKVVTISGMIKNASSTSSDC